MSKNKMFNILASAFVLKKPYQKEVPSKYLILKRSNKERTFPGMWTVPGGKLHQSDYTFTKKETKDYWYNVLEKGLRREVREEAGIEIKNIFYLTSLARLTEEGHGSLTLSFVAEYADGKIKLDEDMTDHAWVTYEEAKKYDLIDGILDEIYLAERKLVGEKDVEWQRAV
ncbi:MAG: NUDIX domain-containing protein [Patescibacteria group bacterium]|nr:NUDIX domain-containing protein [Patescibacteria group bacterium]